MENKETKPVWEFGRTGGQYIGEFPKDAVIKPPYTEVVPLKGKFPDGSEITLDNQIFVTSKQEWQLIKSTVDSEKLDTVQTLLDAQIEKADTLESMVTESQEALAELYENMLGEN